MDLKIGDSVRPIDLVVFDCDGVLLDTMPAKIDAFRQWVPETHEALREPFMRYVMRSFGKSRTYHVAHFYRDLAGESPDQDFLDAEVDRFAAICEPLCARAEWRPGSRAFVERCRTAGVKRYVLSGVPQENLEAMLEATDAAQYFEVIIGSPPGKRESLARILAETAVTAERTVFIGDANADQDAALHAGVHFVYFPSQAERPQAPVIAEVNDLRDLLTEGTA